MQETLIAMERIAPVGVVCAVCGKPAAWERRTMIDAPGLDLLDGRCANHPFNRYHDVQHVADLKAEVTRLRRALERIQQWDMLNPPQERVCEDFPWLRFLVDNALQEGSPGGVVMGGDQ